jgi:hypothetical protein
MAHFRRQSLAAQTAGSRGNLEVPHENGGLGGLLRSSQVCARRVRLGTGRLGLANGRAPPGSVFAQNGCSLVAKRLGYGGVRFDLAEQSDQRVDVGGCEGSVCFRQERLPHRLALEADVGGMALLAAQGAGNAFAGFWHGGAFSRLATTYL